MFNVFFLAICFMEFANKMGYSLLISVIIFPSDNLNPDNLHYLQESLLCSLNQDAKFW